MAIAGKVLTAVNFLIAILAFWMVLEPSNQSCETVREDGTLRVTEHLIPGGPPLDLGDLLTLIGALAGFVFPLLAIIRTRSLARGNRSVDWTLSALALTCTIFWAGMAYSNLPTQSGILVFILALSMMLGSLYAMMAFYSFGHCAWRMRAPRVGRPLI